MNAIWITEQSLLDLGRGTVIERLVRKLDNVAIGVPECLLDQLPQLNCHKYVVESEEALHAKIRTYFEGEEIVSMPSNHVITKSGSVDIATYRDLETAREWVKAEAPKVYYVGQRLYFGKQVPQDAMWLELVHGYDCNWNVLLEIPADLFVFFMPHHVPPEIKRKLAGRMVGIHAEPLPKHIGDKYITSDDVHKRLIALTAAFDLGRTPVYPPTRLYHHDKTSFPTLEREGVHVKEFISAIDTDTFFPLEKGATFSPEEREKKWDLIFYGRETEHRLGMMLAAKHQFGARFLHIAHGIDGDELNRLQNMAKLGINCHTEGIPAIENRIQVMMASGLFVLSEPLSHNDCFIPGQHFIEFHDANELIHKARYYLEHEDEREKIARAGREFVVKNLAARVKWPALFDEVLI